MNKGFKQACEDMNVRALPHHTLFCTAYLICLGECGIPGTFGVSASSGGAGRHTSMQAFSGGFLLQTPVGFDGRLDHIALVCTGDVVKLQTIDTSEKVLTCLVQ